MTPVDLYVDFTPIRTQQLAVTDGQGQRLEGHWTLPPIGGGVDARAFHFGERETGLWFSGSVSQTSRGYELTLDWEPTSWSGALELSVRSRFGRSANGPLTAEGEVGSGPCVEVLAQPWWEDYAYLGVSAHVGVVLVIGDGHTRGMLGVRTTAAVIPAYVQGALDSSLADVSWSWTPIGVRVAVRAGVAFR